MRVSNEFTLDLPRDGPPKMEALPGTARDALSAAPKGPAAFEHADEFASDGLVFHSVTNEKVPTNWVLFRRPFNCVD